MPRVLNFKQFTDLPDGVVYSHYEPCITTGLFRRGPVLRYEDDQVGGCAPHRKGDAFDFWELDLIAAPNPNKPEGPDGHYPIEPPADSWCRWGSYSYDDLYVVYDEADVLALIKGLRWPNEGLWSDTQVKCGCECHEPGSGITHYDPCCEGPCPACGDYYRRGLQEHLATCPIAKSEFRPCACSCHTDGGKHATNCCRGPCPVCQTPLRRVR